MRNEQNSTDTRLAVHASEAARVLGISDRHLWALVAAGKAPPPVALGRSKRWNLRTLQAWLDAGGPPMDEWNATDTTKGADR